jgi:hypothetical protein
MSQPNAAHDCKSCARARSSSLANAAYAVLASPLAEKAAPASARTSSVTSRPHELKRLEREL